MPVIVAPSAHSIAVAVLTAPRRVATLNHTLRGLRRAGFGQPIHLFAEPGSPIPSDEGLVVTQRRSRLGLWDNWRSAAAALLDHTEAEFFLICEDDVVFCTAAALALQHLIASKDHASWGYASLYTARHHVRNQDWNAGWQTIDVGSDGWGALAYCYSRESLTAVLDSEAVQTHRSNHVDVVVANAFRTMGRDRWYHVPSLAAHAGCGVSTLGHHAHPGSTAVAFRDDFQGYVSASAHKVAALQSGAAPKSAPAISSAIVSPVPVLINATDTKSSLNLVSPKPTPRRAGKASPPPACDVVIPYCSADVRYLPVAVDSILNQTGVEPVIHLINDGVPEEEDAGRLFRGVRGVHRYRNNPGGVGPYVSTNRIVRHFKTDFLAIQDADDVALPHRLIRALQQLEEHGAQIYGAAMEQFIDFSWREDAHLVEHLRLHPTLTSGMVTASNPSGFILNGTMVIRKETFLAVGGYSNWIRTADCEFSERVLRTGAGVCFDKTIVARRRLRGDSLSNAEGHRLGTESNLRRHAICRKRLTLHGRPGIDPRLWGGLAVESNGIGTERLEDV
ncbi:MAG: glycosyltransferase [Planctomycetaceae bacterium]|nr:glycosyltransferase [Planctomycetaceae bacterium]